MAHSETLLRLLLHGLLQQLTDAADIVEREGGVKALHDYRVVLRKLRVALRFCRRYWGKAAVAPLERQLKREHGRTSRHRDRDVVSDVLRGIKAPAAAIDAWSALATPARPRARSTRAVAAQIDRGVAALLEREPARSEGRERLVQRVVDTATRRAARRAVALDAAAPRRHAYRTALRRLRYTIDLLSAHVSKPERRFARQVDALQRALGQLRDLDLTRAALPRLRRLSRLQRIELTHALETRRSAVLRAATNAARQLAGTAVVTADRA
jgi:CHAD domain-containing protein